MGNWLYYFSQRIRGIRAVIDYEFPNLISIEITSCCNLTCTHCPSHNNQSNEHARRVFGSISYSLFEKIMHEIDKYGPRRLMLHKDGEPLLNPDIAKMLIRLKVNNNHQVYLTTNGILLNGSVAKAILDARIDHVNVSIGASSNEMYHKIRGGDLGVVKKNVTEFITLIKKSRWKPKLSVQIIDLEQYDMKDEIDNFIRFWKPYNITIWVWDELTWGLKKSKKRINYRYPCYSLWDSFNINSDGKVTACCMDWGQSLVIGNIAESSIKSIWRGERLTEYRRCHLNNEYDEMEICKNCNYWHWQPMLPKYLY